jgi:hypothetical protein
MLQSARCNTAVAPHHIAPIESEEVHESVAIIGTPEPCSERIPWLSEEFQLSELLCWFNPGGLLPPETVLTSMSRFATHVMPNVY